jgi:hypothetical protein
MLVFTATAGWGGPARIQPPNPVQTGPNYSDAWMMEINRHKISKRPDSGFIGPRLAPEDYHAMRARLRAAHNF